jgi:integrase/recombinase XerD
MLNTAQLTRQTFPGDVYFDAKILAGRIAPSSVVTYQRDFDAYKRWAFNHPSGGDYLEKATFERWITYMEHETTLSPKSINRRISAVKRIMRKASQQGYIDERTGERFRLVEGVKVKAMKDRLKANARTRISPDDMRRICEAPNPNTLTGIRDRALLLTMASSGCRIEEITTLTMSQIHKRGKGYILTVMGKNQTEDREAPLSSEAQEAIQAWIVARRLVTRDFDSTIFTGFQGRSQRPLAAPISPASAWKTVQKYAKVASLAHVKPHDFRRFVGTQLAKDDIRKAQKALGHKSIETTARHYVLDELEPGLTDGLF